MLQVEHLTKRYGAVTAVDDLSFEIESEGVYGFLGPNGAGKTTTMNIMTGCLSATQGTVRISGCDIYEEPRAANAVWAICRNSRPSILVKRRRNICALSGRPRACAVSVCASRWRT